MQMNEKATMLSFCKFLSLKLLYALRKAQDTLTRLWEIHIVS